MFETERLILRPLDRRDVEPVFAMRKDKNVMRFIREPQNRQESINWLKLVSSRWKDEKIGFCAVLEKRTAAFVGWCGLWRLKETGEIEIGYAIAGKFWGKGFATEAAARFLRYGFDELNLKKIVAVAAPENASSRRVMEKLGLKFVKTGVFYEKKLVQYAIERENYKDIQTSENAQA